MTAASTSDSIVTRNARYAISAVFFVFGGLVGSWLPHVADVKAALHLSDQSLGFALLGSGLGAVTIMPAMGTLIHRFGSRAIALLGGFLACLLVMPLLLEKSFLGVLLNLFVLGLCYGLLDVAMNCHSVAIQNRSEKSILAAIHGWFSFGGIAGGAGAALAFELGIPPFFHLAASCIFLMAILWGSSFYLLPAETDKNSEGPRFVLPHGILLVLGFLCVCAFMMEGGVLDWCALYLRNDLGAKPAMGGIATSVCSAAMAGSRFVGDSIIPKLGARKVVMASGLVVAAGIWAGVNTHSVVGMIVCFGVACLGVANMIPIFFLAAGAVPNVSVGAAMAAVTTCGYAGFLIGPSAIGFVADRTSLGFSLGMLGALGLAVTGVSRFVLPSGAIERP